ncbi:inositol-pentakisphosphate 2-kinase IPK1 isoform X4 [Magnolia sinica]|uniref:inositol-pentakisphosphate 2-kinase IPK1 isoform X4 n=1 Tax=Magnolia sinica TaxID=86752 RepID=UPI0026599C3B|nr:inositol-pentakisphosphate 2-kinase IPK1 isoform X4 [Magnolia sinica]
MCWASPTVGIKSLLILRISRCSKHYPSKAGETIWMNPIDSIPYHLYFGELALHSSGSVTLTFSAIAIFLLVERVKRMNLILEGKDASDWNYRGEGAVNLVLGYCGSSPAFVALEGPINYNFGVGKVLRVQKVPRSESQHTTSKSILSRHECLLWNDTQELVTCSSKESLGQLFALHVMSPLLGSEHVDAGIRVLVSEEFLESIEKNVISQRPAWRVDAAKVNTLCDSALLISDHSVFHHGSLKEDLCIAVEIKISRLSEYDPLDLFSGSRERIIQATRALFATPQNNFRIFFNRSLIYGGLGGGMDDAAVSDTRETTEAFEDLLKGVIQAGHGLRLASFLELVGEAIFQSGVLSQLLEVQKFDSFDIEGAIHSYYDIISQPCMACKNLGNDEILRRYSFLHSLSLEESLKIVRDYLIAATAKDCSLMISFRPTKDGDSTSEYSSVFLESTNQNFDYKAYFIDLDMKPLKRMVYYYELDQKIVNRYMQMKNTDCSPCNPMSI